MTDFINVRPAEGLRIRDPERQDHIELEGRVVPHNQYWMRRLRDGDVVIVPEVEKKIIRKKIDESGLGRAVSGDTE